MASANEKKQYSLESELEDAKDKLKKRNSKVGTLEAQNRELLIKLEKLAGEYKELEEGASGNRIKLLVQSRLEEILDEKPQAANDVFVALTNVCSKRNIKQELYFEPVEGFEQSKTPKEEAVKAKDFQLIYSLAKSYKWYWVQAAIGGFSRSKIQNYLNPFFWMNLYGINSKKKAAAEFFKTFEKLKSNANKRSKFYKSMELISSSKGKEKLDESYKLGKLLRGLKG